MPTSSISPSASIGENTTLGHFCVVEDNVTLGRGCLIGHHVVLRAGTIVGDYTRIDDHATLGKTPMRASNTALKATPSHAPTRVGARCFIGAGAVLYVGCALEDHVLVADLASLREDVTVGAHTIIGRGVAVENACAIGRYCKLETNVYITAYSHLEDRVFVAPGVLTSNDNFVGRTKERRKYFKGVTVRRGGRIGVGAVVLPGKEIGPDALVAAGSVLTRDTPAHEIWAGVPAKPLRPVPKEQRLENQGWSDVPRKDTP